MGASAKCSIANFVPLYKPTSNCTRGVCKNVSSRTRSTARDCAYYWKAYHLLLIKSYSTMAIPKPRNTLTSTCFPLRTLARMKLIHLGPQHADTVYPGGHDLPCARASRSTTRRACFSPRYRVWVWSLGRDTGRGRIHMGGLRYRPKYVR